MDFIKMSQIECWFWEKRFLAGLSASRMIILGQVESTHTFNLRLVPEESNDKLDKKREEIFAMDL
jgi:hypothetical protein